MVQLEQRLRIDENIRFDRSTIIRSQSEIFKIVLFPISICEKVNWVSFELFFTLFGTQSVRTTTHAAIKCDQHWFQIRIMLQNLQKSQRSNFIIFSSPCYHTVYPILGKLKSQNQHSKGNITIAFLNGSRSYAINPWVTTGVGVIVSARLPRMINTITRNLRNVWIWKRKWTKYMQTN